MKAAEVPGVSPATFENCGYQTYRSVETGLTARIAMKKAFKHARRGISMLDHDVTVCGYRGLVRSHRLEALAVIFDLTLYLKKL